MKVLVTSATGRFARGIIPALLRAGVSVRGLVRSAESVDALATSGVEPVQGDLRDSAALTRAISGVDKIYLIVPPAQYDEGEIAANVARIARARGIGHLVYHSVVHPYMREIPLHWNKALAQGAIADSGICYTFLQPTNLMQNLQWSWDEVKTNGRFIMPYSADQPITWLDLEDAAAAAVAVLTQPGHAYASHELVSTVPLTRRALAAMLAEALGRPVEAVTMPLEQFFQTGHWPRRPPEQRAIVATMFRHYDQVGFTVGGTGHLRMLLGREPTDYPAFARRWVAQHRD